MTWLFVWAILALIFAFVWVRLKRSNTAIPPSAERQVTEREALRFRLDNDLPI